MLIARALMNRPALLILDEPCAGLDPAAREQFLDDLSVFTARPQTPTLIFVTHHIEEIPSFIKHGLVLKQGHVLASGGIDDVCTSPVLSEAFGRPCHVTRHDGRFYRALKGPTRAPRRWPGVR